MYVKKDYIWNLNTCACEINNYLKSIDDDLVITCDEIIDAVTTSYKEPKKTIPINFNEKRQSVKWKISIFYLLFY